MASAAVSVAGHLVNVTKHIGHGGLCPVYAEGVPLVRWIEIVSEQCVYGALGAVSWLFGMVEI
jgi:hypothetical protein